MSLDELRIKIDKIDREVLLLLNERVKVAAEIGRVKHQHGSPIYVASREEQVLQKLGGLNEGPLSDQALRAIYAEVMSAAIALERPIMIAYLGPEATFTHQAAVKKFGTSLDYMDVPSIADVFKSVSKGEADYGVIPIENSTGGAVVDSMDMFLESDLKITAQIFTQISQCLISQSPIEDIKHVYSKDQGLTQCRNWLHAHLNQASLNACDSTVQAVLMAKDDPKIAAIASSLSAELNGVPVAAENIQDEAGNVTRFLVIGKESSGYVPGVEFKSSFILSLSDEVGALEKALMPFSKRSLNLCKIESRPSKKATWEYCFYIDVLGHFEEEKVAEAVAELKKICPLVKWLGSYPIAK